MMEDEYDKVFEEPTALILLMGIGKQLHTFIDHNHDYTCLI